MNRVLKKIEITAKSQIDKLLNSYRFEFDFLNDYMKRLPFEVRVMKVPDDFYQRKYFKVYVDSQLMAFRKPRKFRENPGKFITPQLIRNAIINAINHDMSENSREVYKAYKSEFIEKLKALGLDVNDFKLFDDRFTFEYKGVRCGYDFTEDFETQILEIVKS